MAAIRAGAAAPKASAPLVRIPPMSAPREAIWGKWGNCGDMLTVGNYLSHYVVYGTWFIHVVCVRYYNVTHDLRTKPCEKTM